MENYQQNKVIGILKLLKYMGFEEVDNSLLNASPFLDLKKEVQNCTKCALHKTRKNPVFGKGPTDAKIMLIGEAPGREEDLQGLPFVGKAGKELDNMLQAAGIEIDEIFITNVVKCRPPGNRNPEPYEMMKCNPYLVKQIQIIRPKVIVLLGNIALSLVTGKASGITKMRGKTYEYLSYPAIPTFHPAYVIRNPESERIVIEDFKKAIRSIA
jgi:uracil-DNA glycosylase family 4